MTLTKKVSSLFRGGRSSTTTMIPEPSTSLASISTVARFEDAESERLVSQGIINSLRHTLSQLQEERRDKDRMLGNSGAEQVATDDKLKTSDDKSKHCSILFSKLRKPSASYQKSKAR
jgi:hypothetical protein